jgi:hypothetical protein
MNGGAIIGNIARYGGGLSVHNDWWDNNSSNPNKGSATINNGLIKYNFSSNHSGGIHTDGANYIHMTGGTIINNYTVGNHNSDVGGGLIISNGTPGAIAGSVIVRGNQSENDGPNNNININVASAQTQAFDLTGGFNSDADVYVYAINWTPSSADAKIAYNATLNDIKYIHSDNADGAGVIFFDGDRDWIYDSTNDEFLPISRTNKHQYNLSQANTIWLSTNASTTHLPDNLAFTLTLASDGNGTAVVKTPLPTGVTNNQNGSYAVDNNTELQLEASPATDYHFVQWQDNNSNNPRTITVTENATYTAIFAIDEYRIDSIPTSWQVKIGEGDSFAPTPYGDEHPDSGYVMIPVGAEFLIIPSNEQKPLVSKLELIDKILDLSLVTTDTIVPNGWTVTGTLGSNVKISIADGATVTLDGVTINGVHSYNSYKWAGITCLGNATIILADEATNTVKGFNEEYPGVFVPVGSTLTIKGETAGTGELIASSNGWCSGIGCGYSINCGNIVIEGGNITATGSHGGAGIGGATNSSCGNIVIKGGNIMATGTGEEGGAGIGSGKGSTSSCSAISISGGTVTATGGGNAAGIGSGGYSSSCGDITIVSTVTRVTATKGSGATNSIGAGNNSTCGTVTIGGVEGAISTSPYTYIPGAISGKFSVSSTKQVYFSQGNLQATTSNKGSTWTWAFAAHQWDYIGDAVANNSVNGNGTVATNGTVDLFGWSTAATTFGILNSTISSNYSGDFVDWGATIGSGWRTLTSDEWQYVFNTRNASTVNSTENARYAKAYLFGTKHGVILFPDSYTHPDGVAAPTGINATNYASWDANKYSADDWAKMEAAGCVFLPAAGYRSGSTVCDVGSYGYYWSSSFITTNYTYRVYFYYGSMSPTNYNDRYNGCSVRLVRDAE